MASEWFSQFVKSRKGLAELVNKGILYGWSCYPFPIRCAARWSAHLLFGTLGYSGRSVTGWVLQGTISLGLCSRV